PVAGRHCAPIGGSVRQGPAGRRSHPAAGHAPGLALPERPAGNVPVAIRHQDGAIMPHLLHQIGATFSHRLAAFPGQSRG
ncbi:radical SAM family heme chaperone HemW, partial [Achromobacter xylosoxidans]